MSELSKEEEFLLKEYDAAQKLTFHIDELRSKLTQFFLIFTGFATAALTLLLKGEASKSVFEKPEGAVAILVFVAAALGSTFVLIIARLRRAQIEHFQIVNNIRTYFLQNNYKLWDIVQLSAKTLPKPNRLSGSYFWVLLIIIASSYLYMLTIYIHLTKVFDINNYNLVFIICAVVTIAAIFLHDKLYFALAKPPLPKKYSEEKLPSE